MTDKTPCEKHLRSYLHGSPDPDILAAAERHVADCTECSRRLSQLLFLGDALRSSFRRHSQARTLFARSAARSTPSPKPTSPENVAAAEAQCQNARDNYLSERTDDARLCAAAAHILRCPACEPYFRDLQALGRAVAPLLRRYHEARQLLTRCTKPPTASSSSGIRTATPRGILADCSAPSTDGRATSVTLNSGVSLVEAPSRPGARWFGARRSQSASQGDPLSLILTPTDCSSLLLYAADLGVFAKHGFDLHGVFLTNWLQNLDLLLGELPEDACILVQCLTTELFARLGNAKRNLLDPPAALYPVSPLLCQGLWLSAPAKAPISGLADLLGRTVLVTHSCSNFLLRLFLALEHEGIPYVAPGAVSTRSPSQGELVRFRRVPFEALLPGLRDGHAIFTVEPYHYLARRLAEAEPFRVPEHLIRWRLPENCCVAALRPPPDASEQTRDRRRRMIVALQEAQLAYTQAKIVAATRVLELLAQFGEPPELRSLPTTNHRARSSAHCTTAAGASRIVLLGGERFQKWNRTALVNEIVLAQGIFGAHRPDLKEVDPAADLPALLREVDSVPSENEADTTHSR